MEEDFVPNWGKVELFGKTDQEEDSDMMLICINMVDRTKVILDNEMVQVNMKKDNTVLKGEQKYL